MLKAQIPCHSLHNQLPPHNSVTGGNAASHSSSSAYSATVLRQPILTKKSSAARRGIVNAISLPFHRDNEETTVQAVITVQPTIQSALHCTVTGAVADTIYDLIGRSFVLELISNDLNSWKKVKASAYYVLLDYDLSVYTYKCNFKVPNDFGEIGAVLVENEYHNKMFFKSIVLNNGVTFTCESWVHSKHDNTDNRLFFSDKKVKYSDII